jgi:hypothetical protein
MTQEAIDRKRRARKSAREDFDSSVIELCEEAAAVFFVAWGHVGGHHLLEFKIRP